MLVKLPGSMCVCRNAMRHSTELAAKASSANRAAPAARLISGPAPDHPSVPSPVGHEFAKRSLETNSISAVVDASLPADSDRHRTLATGPIDLQWRVVSQSWLQEDAHYRPFLSCRHRQGAERSRQLADSKAF